MSIDAAFGMHSDSHGLLMSDAAGWVGWAGVGYVMLVLPFVFTYNFVDFRLLSDLRGFLGSFITCTLALHLTLSAAPSAADFKSASRDALT